MPAARKEGRGMPQKDFGGLHGWVGCEVGGPASLRRSGAEQAQPPETVELRGSMGLGFVQNFLA